MKDLTRLLEKYPHQNFKDTSHFGFFDLDERLPHCTYKAAKIEVRATIFSKVNLARLNALILAC